LLLVERPDGSRAVAVDRLGAGPGDRVLTAHGSRVRDLTVGETVPLKDVVIAIVDGVDA
jgi:microcompartment protein CcmK/EutM